MEKIFFFIKYCSFICPASGYFGNKWLLGEFSPESVSHKISVREFLPIVIAFEIWGSCPANSIIVIHSDNSAVVHVLNKTTSKDSKLMHLIRRIMICLHFQAEYIYLLLLKQPQIYFLDNRLKNLWPDFRTLTKKLIRFHNLSSKSELNSICSSSHFPFSIHRFSL